MIDASGARNGVAHMSMNRGWDSGPSHQVGLPRARLDIASASIAKASTNQEAAVTLRHVRVSRAIDFGTGGGGISDITLQGTTRRVAVSLIGNDRDEI